MTPTIPASTYLRYRDAGHSWLRVPVSEVRRLGIDHLLSDCSPEQDGFRFLEGDCDVELFLDALRARNESLPEIRTEEIDDFWLEIMEVSR